MAIDQIEYNVVTLIEQEYHLSGNVPSQQAIADQLNWPVATVIKLMKRDDFKKAMLARGITSLTATTNGILTSEQLTCINTLLDQNDNRSDKKKLADLGIATQTYQGWCRDPTFKDYLARRTEALFPDGLNEANRALVDNVKRGDLGSIKLIYEMTGRWSSKPAAEMNIEWVLMKVFETISKHVTDQQQLAGIAQDLGAIQEAVVPAPLRSSQGFNPLTPSPSDPPAYSETYRAIEL